MSFEAVAWALEAPVGGTQKVVLIGIASHADKFGNNAWPSIETLAGYAFVDPRSVQRAINDLVKMGLVSKQVNEGGSRQTAAHMRPNLYRLNMDFQRPSDPLTPASPPDASVTPPLTPVSPPPLTPVSPPPLTPVSPEQSIEPSLEPSLNTHTPLVLVAPVCGEVLPVADGVEKTGEQADQQADATVPLVPTAAGSACLAMRSQGVADVNPAHPKLAALLAAGATNDELAQAATVAAGKGKGFAYALAIVERQRTDAASMSKRLHKGAMPAAQGKPAQSFAQTDREAAMTRWEQATGCIHPDRHPAAQPTAHVVDAVATGCALVDHHVSHALACVVQKPAATTGARA